MAAQALVQRIEEYDSPRFNRGVHLLNFPHASLFGAGPHGPRIKSGAGKFILGLDPGAVGNRQVTRWLQMRAAPPNRPLNIRLRPLAKGGGAGQSYLVFNQRKEVI